MNGWSKFADEFWSPRGFEGDDSSRVEACDSEAIVVADVAYCSSSSGAHAAPRLELAPRLSKARAKAIAKKEVDNMRKASVNTLHAVGRALCGEEIKFEVRAIGYLYEPEAHAFGKMLAEMRSSEKVRLYYSQWAHWSWLDEVKAHINVIGDLTKLERCGLRVGLSASAIKGVWLGHPQVAYEDCRAKTMYQNLVCHMKHRCGNMIWHTYGVGDLVGLVHEDDAKVEASLNLFKAIARTVEKAEVLHTPLIKELLEAQFFTANLGKWALNMLKLTDCEAVPPVLAKVLHQIWEGLLNSKLAEDLNRQIREREQISTPSKQLARLEAWQCGTHHKVIDQYHRREINEIAALQVPTSFNFDRLFEHKCVDEEEDEAINKESATLDKVIASMTWPTFNPASMQQQFIDVHLLMHAEEEGAWGQLSDSWKAGLVPERSVLIRGTREQFIVKKCLRGLLGWNLKRLSADVVAFDTSVSKLDIIHIFDVEGVKVQSVQARSPLHQHLRSGAAWSKHGVTMVCTEKLAKLLDHLVSTGFAGVSEANLRNLYEDNAWAEPPVVPESADDVSMALSVHLICQLQPELTAQQALAIMLENKFADEEFVELPEMTDEFMRDVILSNEVHKLKEAHNTMTAKHKSRYDAVVKHRNAVNACFSASQSALGKAVPTTIGKKLTPAALIKQTERLYAAIGKDADKALMDQAPSEASIWTDVKNGRWRLAYSKQHVKRSVPWTNVGEKVASVVALKQLWEWHETFSGSEIPTQLVQLFTNHGVWGRLFG